MINKDVLKNATQFATYLSKFEFVDEVLIIGSQVNGDARSDSDIDICILCEGFDYIDYNTEWHKIKYEINSKIHIIPVSKQNEANMKFYNENKDASVVIFKRQ